MSLIKDQQDKYLIVINFIKLVMGISLLLEFIDEKHLETTDCAINDRANIKNTVRVTNIINAMINFNSLC